MPDNPKVQARVPPEVHDRLNEHIHEQYYSRHGAKSEVIENALREYLDMDRAARIEGEVRDLDEKLDEVLTHLRGEGNTHAHTGSETRETTADSGSPRASHTGAVTSITKRATKPVPELPKRDRGKHVAEVLDQRYEVAFDISDFKRVIENELKVSGERTFSDFYEISRRQGWLYEHPGENIPKWFTEKEAFFNALLGYLNQRPGVHFSDFFDETEYPSELKSEFATWLDERTEEGEDEQDAEADTTESAETDADEPEWPDVDAEAQMLARRTARAILTDRQAWPTEPGYVEAIVRRETDVTEDDRVAEIVARVREQNLLDETEADRWEPRADPDTPDTDADDDEPGLADDPDDALDQLTTAQTDESRSALPDVDEAAVEAEEADEPDPAEEAAADLATRLREEFDTDDWPLQSADVANLAMVVAPDVDVADVTAALAERDAFDRGDSEWRLAQPGAGESGREAATDGGEETR